MVVVENPLDVFVTAVVDSFVVPVNAVESARVVVTPVYAMS